MKLAANKCKIIAVRALAGTEPVSTLAARHGVSRPLAYRQMHKASAALDELFSPAQTRACKSMAHAIVATLIFDGELACLNLFGVVVGTAPRATMRFAPEDPYHEERIKS
ncbi:hypothetical protein [Paraburkholderia aromaticivorans]|uniref:hypothetical protein n=1 Tax=Paraburkholderia aromaticivorans TaxID=2026199 RepID=UPI00145602E2|nr:hypothetical protein [Paraburkholderia aromaticivorans]